MATFRSWRVGRYVHDKRIFYLCRPSRVEATCCSIDLVLIVYQRMVVPGSLASSEMQTEVCFKCGGFGEFMRPNVLTMLGPCGVSNRRSHSGAGEGRPLRCLSPHVQLRFPHIPPNDVH